MGPIWFQSLNMTNRKYWNLSTKMKLLELGNDSQVEVDHIGKMAWI